MTQAGASTYSHCYDPILDTIAGLFRQLFEWQKDKKINRLKTNRLPQLICRLTG